MAFPALQGTPTTIATTVNDTTPTLTYPSSIAADEILICILAIDGNGAASSGWPAGWANLHTTLSGTAVRFETHWKRATGSESGTFDVTTASEMHGAWMGRFSGCHTSTDPAIGTAATGTSANPNSPTLNPAGWDVEDTLWLAVTGLDYATALTISDWPDNFTTFQSGPHGGSNAGAAAVAIAARENAAASEDPTTWTFSGSEQWVAQTIALRPAPAGSVSVTPGNASLTTATFAPTIGHTINMASPTALVLTTFAPTIGHTINAASPTALVLSTFAPTISVSGGGGVSVTPDVASMVLAFFAPTVTATAHQSVTPSTASLAMTAFAPNVVITDHKFVTPDTAALALTGFAPTVTASGQEGPSRIGTPLGTSRGEPVTVSFG